MTNPFRKPKNPFRKSEGTVTLGPVEVRGLYAPDALARQVDPIQAGLKIAQRESNQPAMAQSQEGMRPTASGTAANIALSEMISPLLPRTAEAGVDAALQHFTEAGGDASANANLFGAASALGAVGGNVGMGAALPAPGSIVRGMGLKQIAGQALKAGAVEGVTQGALSGGGALAEGASPEEAARVAWENARNVAALGMAFRGLHGAGPIREAILRPSTPDVDLDVLGGRQEFIPPEGKGRVLRDDTPDRVVATDPRGREVLASGRVISLPEDLRARHPNPFEPQPVRIPTGLEQAEARLRQQVESEPIPVSPPAGSGIQANEDVLTLPRVSPAVAPLLEKAGSATTRIVSGAAGGVGGAAYGATQGDTPKERAKNALFYGLGGLALGATGGYLAERVGAKSAAILEAEREAGKSLVQAGRTGTRFMDTSTPSPFRDAPPPVVEPIPRPGEHGPVEGTPYIRLDKFGMDRDATARLRVEAERIGRETQGSPRRVATWDEWRDTAASLGLGDVARKDYRAMTAPDLLAIRNLVASNTDRLIQLDTEARAPGVSDTELARMNLETSALNSQNDLLFRKFIPARTEAGRTLNSLRIIASRNFEPAWWLAKAQDIKGAPLNDAELAQVRGLLNAQDREGLVRAIARLRQASGLDKAVSYWKANLLSSPKTHLVNTAANIALGTLETVKDIPAALTDQLLSLSTGRRTVAGPSGLQFRAAAEGARDGLQQAKLILRGALPPEALAKLDIPQETHFDNPVLEAYTQTVFRALNAADRVPRMAAVRRALANQAEVLAHTEGLTGEDYTTRVHDLIEHPTSEMAVQATAEAEQAVVQDQTAAGTALRAVGKVPVVGQFIMPFQRTPGAVATRIGEYTFGAPYELGNVTRLAAQGKLKDLSVADQRRIAMLTGRGVTGASLIALGALAYHRGWLTGPPADWSKDRAQATTDALRQSQGNSIVANIAGHRIQFDIGRLSPVGNLVAIGALAARAAEDRDPETSPWAAGMLGAITTVANQPFLQGIQNFTDAANDPSRFGEKLVGGVARGFIPASGLLGAVTRATDPNIHMTEGVGQQMQAQVPGVSRMLPTRPNPLGEPSTRQGGVLGALSQVSPVGVQEQAQGDPVLDALGQYDVTMTGFSPKKGESSTDFQSRARQAGQLRREELDATVNSQEWDADTSFDYRQEMLQQALRRAASRQAQLTRQSRSFSNPFRP